MAMGLLAPQAMGHDPKRQPGAYLLLHEHTPSVRLYCVLGVGQTGSLQCENCQTGYVTWLTSAEVAKARQIAPLPDESVAELEAALASTPDLPDAEVAADGA